MRVILDADAEKLDKLFVSDTIEVNCQKVVDVIFLAIHFQYLVDLIFVNQEALSEVLSNS